MPSRNSDPRYRDRGKRRVGASKFRYRHRRSLAIVLSLALLIVGGGAAYAYMLNNKLSDITKIGAPEVDDSNRPDPDEGKAINILMLGSDAGKGAGGGNSGGASIKDALAQPEWPAGDFRSDANIIMHVSADRKDVYLISIPRDSLVDLYDSTGEFRYTGKVNAAFSYYGPNGARSTIEQLSGLRMSHMAIIDWIGFRDLSTALGGVEVCIPETFYDSGQDIQWEAGCQKLEGKRALAYVRTRKGLTEGDFGRIDRQQNFLRSTMEGLLSKGTFTNPVRLNNVLSAVTENLAVDADWNGADIRSFALSLRGITGDDVKFMTMPIAGYGQDVDNGSFLNVDEPKADELWAAIEEDDVQGYLDKYPDESLGEPEDIE